MSLAGNYVLLRLRKGAELRVTNQIQIALNLRRPVDSEPALAGRRETRWNEKLRGVNQKEMGEEEEKKQGRIIADKSQGPGVASRRTYVKWTNMGGGVGGLGELEERPSSSPLLPLASPRRSPQRRPSSRKSPPLSCSALDSLLLPFVLIPWIMPVKVVVLPFDYCRPQLSSHC